MALLENGKAVLKAPDGVLKLVAPDDAAKAIERLGWVEATPEDIRVQDLQKTRGGVIDQVTTGLEEAGRRVTSGVAGAIRGASNVIEGATGFGTAPGLVDEVGPVMGADLAPGLYDEASLERREANPGAAAIGGELPALPAYLAGGLGGAFAADWASGAAQEAVDAEVEKRDISGASVLRNGALNSVFSGAAFLMPVAARQVLKSTENALQRSAQAVSSRIEASGAKAIQKSFGETVESSFEALEKVKAPKVANNPNAQRQVIELMANTAPDAQVAKELTELIRTTPAKRYAALREMKETAKGDLAVNLERVLEREDLWGPKVVAFERDVLAAKKLRPGADAPVDAWREYADALRRLPDNKFVKAAEQLDELAAAKAVDVWAGNTAKAATKGPIAQYAAGKATGAVGTAVGAVAGGWPGAFIGKTAGDALEPVAMKALGNLTPKVTKGLLDTAEFLKKAAETDRRFTARLLVDTNAASKYLRVAGVGLSPLKRFQAEHESPTEAFWASRTAMEEMRKNPSAMLEMISEQYGDVDEQSPLLFKRMTEQALKVGNYLQGKVPKPRGVSVARPKGTPPTPLEMRTWALHFTAATDPESVMADARAGQLRREQVETLRELWPEEYMDLRNTIMQEMADGRASTTTRQRLSLLFDFDGSLDPALGKKARDLVEASRQKSGPSTPAPQSAMKRASPPSKAGLTPGGMSALGLGAQLDNRG
jgi:hypothetical protein